MLEFLNPFLWGLTFSLIPVFLYFFRFITRKTYLLPTLKIIEEKGKVRGININVEFLRIILRVLMIVIIVLVFSQPILPEGKKEKVIIIVDTTYSTKANFEKYLKYLSEYILSVPSGRLIRVVDVSGNEISGSRDEVKERMRFYFPEVGRLKEDFLERLVEAGRDSEVIVLTDGQRSFLSVLEKAGIKAKVVTFPFTLPNGRVKFSIWRRVGDVIDVKYEIVAEEECYSEVGVEFGGVFRVLASSKSKGRMAGEFRVSAPGEGMGFVKGVLVSSRGTNEFVEPVYFFDGRVEIISRSNFTVVEKAIESIGMRRGASKYKIIMEDFVNSDNIRNSIILPLGERSRLVVGGEDVFFGRDGIKREIREYNFSFLPIVGFTNVSAPRGIEVFGVSGKPILLFDRVRNNVIVLGVLNYRDVSLPWFFKELFEFMLVGSRVEFLYPWEKVRRSDAEKEGKHVVIITPEEEISELTKVEDEPGFRNNVITLILFCLFVVIAVLERSLR